MKIGCRKHVKTFLYSAKQFGSQLLLYPQKELYLIWHCSVLQKVIAPKTEPNKCHLIFLICSPFNRVHLCVSMMHQSVAQGFIKYCHLLSTCHWVMLMYVCTTYIICDWKHTVSCMQLIIISMSNINFGIFFFLKLTFLVLHISLICSLLVLSTHA